MNHTVLMETLTACVLAGMLSACAVGPQYQRPDVPLNERFRNAPPARVAADTTWWQAFEDETLNKLIEQALQVNLDIAQAVARLEQARAGARYARALQLPGIGVEGSAAQPGI